MLRRGNLPIIIIFLVLGLLVGSTFGEILAFVLPEGVVKQFFLKSFIYVFPPATLPLVILSITLGFTIKLNIISILGAVFGLILLKRYLLFYR